MNIKSTLESILFISNKPLSVGELAKLVGSDKSEVITKLDELAGEYNQAGRGVNLIKNKDQVQLVTAGENHKIVEEFIKSELTGEMTRPQLETLTIIAYRGPITKEELEQIRGVNCSLILRNLMIRGLIEQSEDKKAMKNYYQVTLDFIKFLGIHQTSELPDFERLSTNSILEKIMTQSESSVSSSQQLPVTPKKLDL